ncbi:hypothetical protein FACS1894142_2770 [Spirochaetia bacterium]|nr:hypothetical protein FACS1894142_2770 [Spirochaetia bacterium]
MAVPQKDLSYEAGLTFEKVMEGFQETRRIIDEVGRRQAELTKKMEETDRQMEETGRRMKETDKRVGELTNRYGEISEHMIVPNLKLSFKALGYTFEKCGPNVKIESFTHGIFAEADAVLENGDSVMVVEIKTKLRTDDIDDHVKRMEKFRAHADFHNDKRKYYGAIAGIVMSESEKAYALKKGFYLLEPVGETFTITVPHGPGAPRAW